MSHRFLAAAAISLGLSTQAHAEIFWFGVNENTHTMSPCNRDQRFQTVAGMETFVNSWGRAVSWEANTEYGADGAFQDGSGSVIYLTTNPYACRNTTADLEEHGYLVQDDWRP
jgi:hypothetical protein